MWHYIICNTLCSVTGSFIACVESLNYLQERMVYCCGVQKTAFFDGFLLGLFFGFFFFLEQLHFWNLHVDRNVLGTRGFQYSEKRGMGPEKAT